ncbi:ATP-dependent nuclease [Pseudomonas aeruginosa]
MRVKIERFKNLEDIEIELSDITILVGGNNAGKTSVLQAMQFGASAAQTTALVNGIWRHNRVATSIGQSELIYSPIKDVLSLGYNGQLRQTEAEQIKITYTTENDESTVLVLKGKNKNIRLTVEGGQGLGRELQQLDPPFCALVTGLAGIPAEEDFETKIVIRKAAAKGDSNSVFRNILLQLRSNNEKWESFSSQLESIFPGYAIDVGFNIETDETIRCTVNRNGSPYPIDSCGTGVLQAIQIFSYINLFSPKVLLLDEPDSHLHPNNQKALAAELIEVAKNGTKIVISTHSRHIIDALKDDAKLVWLRNGVIEEDAPDYELNALLEIGALNVGERLRNPSKIILTEDSDTSLFELLLEANGYDLDDCDILSYSGCTNISTAVALIEHIKRSHPNAQYIIHRDRDFLSPEDLERYTDKLTPHGVEIFIPDGNDLEHHFIMPEHISETCNIDIALARQIVNTAFTTRQADLRSKYINTRSMNILKRSEKPDAGAIANECIALMLGPDAICVHGKILLKGVRDELRNQGIADNIMTPSRHLSIQRLQELGAAD